MSDNNSVNWSTVGAAWGLSTLTAIMILLGLFGVRAYKRFQNKRLQFNRATRHPVTESRSAVRGGNSRASSASRQVLLNTSRQNSSSDVEQGPKTANSRRSTDFTSRWCTEHGLSEHTATALRGEGFLSQATVDSLTDDVIPSLGLRGKGQECLLRKVISQLNTSTDAVASGVTSPTRLAPVCERPRSYHLSNSEDVISGSAEPLRSPATAPLLEKAQSMERLNESSSQMTIGGNC
ncbi:hypothetical protein LSAT2_016451 [Lamellibrachia satsuma]|nr:hypothetical protein LSAT2_016451 [Lamellibrachia satsuma]